MLRSFSKRLSAFLMGILFITVTFSLSFAAIPSTVAVSGRLTNPSGTVLTGSYNFTFNIYNTQTGGTPLWTEYHDGRPAASSVSASKGVWTTVLGNNTSLNLPWNETYFLEIMVEGETLSPRGAFTAAPYITNRTDPGDYNFTGKIHIKDGGILNVSLTANNITSGTLGAGILPTVFTTAHVFTGTNPTFTNGMIISGGTINLLNNTEFNATINAANITIGSLAAARLPTVFTTAHVFTGTNPTFTNGAIISGGSLHMLNNTKINVSLSADNITNATFVNAVSIEGVAGPVLIIRNTTGSGVTLASFDTAKGSVNINASGPDVLNVTSGATRLFDIDATSGTGLARFSTPVNFLQPLNLSLRADNITNRTFPGAVNIIYNPGAPEIAFNISDGSNRFFEADIGNRQIRINSGIGPDTLNISSNTNRVFDIDGVSRIVRITSTSAAAFNITDGASRFLEAGTTGSQSGRLRIISNAVDLLNISNETHRIFDIDGTVGSSFARFSTSSTNFSGTVNITSAGLLVAGSSTFGNLAKFGNVSQNAPVYWNTSSLPTYNSSSLIQAGQRMVTCSNVVPWGSTFIVFGKAYTEANTFVVSLAFVAPDDQLAFPSLSYMNKSSAGFTVVCSHATTLLNVSWSAIGY